MSCLTTAELAQFDQATYVAKWLEANDVDAQRKVLSQLCSHGLIDQIRIVITAGFNPNVHNFRPVIGPSGRHNDDKSLLRLAIEKRKWQVVRVLLECGADPKLARVEYVQSQRRKSVTMESNLMRVIQMAFDDDTKEAAALLLENGADLKPDNSPHESTCVHHMVRGPAPKWYSFISQQFPRQFLEVIDARDDRDLTPASYAVNNYVKLKKRRSDQMGFYFMAHDLLAHLPTIVGRDITLYSAPKKFENRAILVLLNELELIFDRRGLDRKEEYKDIKKLIEQLSEDTTICDMLTDCGDTPIHYFASLGFVHLLKRASDEQLRRKNKQNWTALHFAAERGSYGSIEYLLERVPDCVYVLSGDGQTPIDVAEQNEKWLCAQKLLECYSESEETDDDNVSLEFEFESKQPVTKTVHFHQDEPQKLNTTKIGTVLQQLENRPQSEIVSTLNDVIDHQTNKINELSDRVRRQELEIAKLISTDNNNEQK